jgi:hypothetical protein
MSSSSLRIKIVARGLAWALGALFAHTASAAPDISGVWKATKYQSRITTVEGEAPPLQPWAAEIYRRNSAAHGAGDLAFDAPFQACLSPGLARLIRLPYPIQIIQRPHQLTMLFQWNDRFRIVDLSGMPPVVDYPGYIGVGVGRVEDETLVLDTIGLIETTFLDEAGMPHSEELRLTERYRLKDNGRTLLNEITVDDPKTFTRPWRTQVVYRKLPAKTEIVEDVCRDRVAAGGPPFDLRRWD